MNSPKSLIMLIVGALLLGVSLIAPVEHRIVGVVVGSFLLLVGVCPLIRRWPKEPDDGDQAGA